jgi:hypothetical protein
MACSSDKGTVHIFSLAEKSAGSSAKEEGSNGSNSHLKVAGNSNDNSSSNSNLASSPSASDRERDRDRASAERDGNTLSASPSSSSASAVPNKSLGLTFLRGIVPKGLMPKYLDRFALHRTALYCSAPLAYSYLPHPASLIHSFLCLLSPSSPVALPELYAPYPTNDCTS